MGRSFSDQPPEGIPRLPQRGRRVGGGGFRRVVGGRGLAVPSLKSLQASWSLFPLVSHTKKLHQAQSANSGRTCVGFTFHGEGRVPSRKGLS